MRFFSLAFLMAFICNANAQSGAAYLCVADKATGFVYNQNTDKWDFSQFNVTDSKYTLSQKNGNWVWKKFGEKSYPVECQGDFNQAGFLFCSFAEEVSINIQTMRFMSVYKFGYVVPKHRLKEQGSDTPLIEIGRCSAIQ